MNVYVRLDMGILYEFETGEIIDFPHLRPGDMIVTESEVSAYFLYRRNKPRYFRLLTCYVCKYQYDGMTGNYYRTNTGAVKFICRSCHPY